MAVKENNAAEELEKLFEERRQQHETSLSSARLCFFKKLTGATEEDFCNSTLYKKLEGNFDRDREAFEKQLEEIRKKKTYASRKRNTKPISKRAKKKATNKNNTGGSRRIQSNKTTGKRAKKQPKPKAKSSSAPRATADQMKGSTKEQKTSDVTLFGKETAEGQKVGVKPLIDKLQKSAKKGDQINGSVGTQDSPFISVVKGDSAEEQDCPKFDSKDKDKSSEEGAVVVTGEQEATEVNIGNHGPGHNLMNRESDDETQPAFQKDTETMTTKGANAEHSELASKMLSDAPHRLISQPMTVNKEQEQPCPSCPSTCLLPAYDSSAPVKEDIAANQRASQNSPKGSNTDEYKVENDIPLKYNESKGEEVMAHPQLPSAGGTFHNCSTHSSHKTKNVELKPEFTPIKSKTSPSRPTKATINGTDEQEVASPDQTSSNDQSFENGVDPSPSEYSSKGKRDEKDISCSELCTTMNCSALDQSKVNEQGDDEVEPLKNHTQSQGLDNGHEERSFPLQGTKRKAPDNIEDSSPHRNKLEQKESSIETSSNENC